MYLSTRISLFFFPLKKQQQVCDFYPDCNEGEDEKMCPTEYFFENCQDTSGESLCYWEEEPHDELDWIIAAGNYK
jgi:hypothetical protein